MRYSESESAWLNRRADRIAEERGWPLPIARCEAEAELTRLRSNPTAIVLEWPPADENSNSKVNG